jgi:hypothetical protein
MGYLCGLKQDQELGRLLLPELGIQSVDIFPSTPTPEIPAGIRFQVAKVPPTSSPSADS